jgi:hypothetical protein
MITSTSTELMGRVGTHQLGDATLTDAESGADLNDMRALSVRRPWAGLIMAGHKTVENRGWRTSYRGPLIVHAGKAYDSHGYYTAIELGIEVAGVDPATWDLVDAAAQPSGYLGVVDLVDIHWAFDCERHEQRPDGSAHVAGYCSPWAAPGFCWHWELANPRPLLAPISGPGRLGLYASPTEVSAAFAELGVAR